MLDTSQLATQQARGVKTTSNRRRCDVMTSHRRWYDVVSRFCAFWVSFFPYHVHAEKKLDTNQLAIFFTSFIVLIQKKTQFHTHTLIRLRGCGRGYYQSFPHSVKTVCILLLRLNQYTKSKNHYLFGAECTLPRCRMHFNATT